MIDNLGPIIAAAKAIPPPSNTGEALLFADAILENFPNRWIT